jgi:hypothetical protein
MSGTALNHRLVRAYLRELDAALRGLPAAQGRELEEQITAHLQDSHRPANRPDHQPGEHPEVGRDQEPAAHQHRHAGPAPRAADLGGAGPSDTQAACRHARSHHPLTARTTSIRLPW